MKKKIMLISFILFFYFPINIFAANCSCLLGKWKVKTDLSFSKFPELGHSVIYWYIFEGGNDLVQGYSVGAKINNDISQGNFVSLNRKDVTDLKILCPPYESKYLVQFGKFESFEIFLSDNNFKGTMANKLGEVRISAERIESHHNIDPNIFVFEKIEEQETVASNIDLDQESKAYVLIATVLYQKNDWKELIKHAKKWTEADPNSFRAWRILSLAYEKSNQHDNAIDALQKALSIHPEDAEGWFRLGIAYYETGQLSQAIDATQQALSINPENETGWWRILGKYWTFLGIEYAEEKQYSKAIFAFQNSVEINTEDATAWHVLGMTYYLDNQPSKVMEVHQRLKKLDSAKANELFKLAFPKSEVSD